MGGEGGAGGGAGRGETGPLHAPTFLILRLPSGRRIRREATCSALTGIFCPQVLVHTVTCADKGLTANYAVTWFSRRDLGGIVLLCHRR